MSRVGAWFLVMLSLLGIVAAISAPVSAQIPPGPAGVTVSKGNTLWAQLASTNTFTSDQTLSAGAIFNGALLVKGQTFSANGTIDPTQGSRVQILNSGITVSLPAVPTAKTVLIIAYEAGSGTSTLSGNGNNIDGSPTVSISAGRIVEWSGTNSAWYSASFTKSQADVLYASLTAGNTYTGSQTWSGPTVYSRQSFNATGNISSSGAPLVEYTGSTGSQTLTLPSASSGLTYTVVNNASVTVTLSGNSQNVDGAASLSIAANGGTVVVQSDASTWHTTATNQVFGTATYGRLGSANTWTTSQTFSGSVIANGNLNANGRLNTAQQTFASNGATIGTLATTSTLGCVISVTGSSGGTLNLPSSPSNQQTFIVKNSGSASFTLAGNGVNVEGSASQTITAGMCRWVRYNNTQWEVIGGYL